MGKNTDMINVALGGAT